MDAIRLASVLLVVGDVKVDSYANKVEEEVVADMDKADAWDMDSSFKKASFQVREKFKFV